MPISLRSRLAATAAAASLLLAAASHTAGAQVVYSGVLDRTVPTSNTGLNLNVVDGTAFTGPGAYPGCPGMGCNFDLSLFGSSTVISSFYSPGAGGQSSAVTADQRGYVSATASGAPIVLTPGSLIGSMSIFNGAVQTSSTTNFLGGANLFLGFRFRDEADGNAVHYGWARLTLPTTGAGTLVDYAYNATAGAPIAAGDVGGLATVPEPSTYVLLGSGLASLAAITRRRRRA